MQMGVLAVEKWVKDLGVSVVRVWSWELPYARRKRKKKKKNCVDNQRVSEVGKKEAKKKKKQNYKIVMEILW